MTAPTIAIGPTMPWPLDEQHGAATASTSPKPLVEQTATATASVTVKRRIDGDMVILVLTAGAVLAVAAIAAVNSYSHIYELGRHHHQDGTAARLLPLSVDGLIAAASLVMLHAARNGRAVPFRARLMLGLGVAATIAANVLYGLPYGWLSAVISAWSAVAFIGCVELLVKFIDEARQAASKAASDGTPADRQEQPAKRARWRPKVTVIWRRIWRSDGTPNPVDEQREPGGGGGSGGNANGGGGSGGKPPNKGTAGAGGRPPKARSPRAKAAAILAANPGITDADVAKRARTSESTVRRARQDLATAARATVTAINGERAS